jgi:hypothetical protein
VLSSPFTSSLSRILHIWVSRSSEVGPYVSIPTVPASPPTSGEAICAPAVSDPGLRTACRVSEIPPHGTAPRRSIVAADVPLPLRSAVTVRDPPGYSPCSSRTCRGAPALCDE